jgi:hypothetical protein
MAFSFKKHMFSKIENYLRRKGIAFTQIKAFILLINALNFLIKSKIEAYVTPL